MEPGSQGIYVTSNSPIKSLAGLRGRTIAINAPKNILYLLVASVLAEHVISPQSVKFVTNIPFAAMPAALKAGKVDAAVLPEPFCQRRGAGGRGGVASRPGSGRDHELPGRGLRGDQAVGREVPAHAGGLRPGAGTGPGDRRQ